MYLHFFLYVCGCVFACVSTDVFFLCCVHFCRSQALSASMSCPPCQTSGIYKSRQWKTDHQASSCHTSILPRASKDSLQHALLIPMLLQTRFSAAFHWFFVACWGRRQQEARMCRCLQSCMYLQGCNFLFKFMLSLTPL